MLFDDDVTYENILNTDITYKVKMFSSQVMKYDPVVWKNESKRIALKGTHTKHSQNGYLDTSTWYMSGSIMNEIHINYEELNVDNSVD